MGAAMQNWIAPTGVRIPDFIICGAMKSGTSTLHYILNQHPDVFIPDRELHFFDMDNVFQHPDFNYFDGKSWSAQNIENDPLQFWSWYSSHFEDAKEDQVIGEDSTTYMTSERTAERIQLQNKEIKLVILLRNPTMRAYSHYWHLVRTGRAVYNFEETIRFEPYSILYRSLYLEQLRGFLKHVPKERVKVVIFEEFLADKCNTLKEVCGHIGVDYGLLPGDSIDSHKNRARTPRFPAVQLLKNRLFREGGNQRYISSLPVKFRSTGRRQLSPVKGLNSVHRLFNPLVQAKPPRIGDATRQFLDNYFKRELKGLNEVLDKDVLSIWFD
jgi:hypothetical protein